MRKSIKPPTSKHTHKLPPPVSHTQIQSNHQHPNTFTFPTNTTDAHLAHLEELYLAHNAIESLAAFKGLARLNTLVRALGVGVCLSVCMCARFPMQKAHETPTPKHTTPHRTCRATAWPRWKGCRSWCPSRSCGWGTIRSVRRRVVLYIYTTMTVISSFGVHVQTRAHCTSTDTRPMVVTPFPRKH